MSALKTALQALWLSALLLALALPSAAVAS